MVSIIFIIFLLTIDLLVSIPLSIANMTSIINSILQKYNDSLKSYHNQHSTEQLSEEHQAKFEWIGKEYLKMIHYRLLPPELFKKMTEELAKKQYQIFIKGLEEKFHREQGYIHQAFGMYINSELDQKNQTLNAQFELQMQKIQDNKYQENDYLQKQSIKYSQLQSPNNLDSSMSSDTKFQTQSSSNFGVQSSTIDNQDTFYYNQDDQKQEYKFKSNQEEARFFQVVDYLMALGSSQSELTYICQHLGWQLPQYNFLSYNADNASFKCSCSIEVDKKEKIQESCTAKNKKKGRYISATLVLKRLYLQHPGVWQEYQKIKKEQGLSVPKSDQKGIQEQLMIRNNKISKIVLLTKEKVNIKQDLELYMSKVDSAKAELNLLIQQCPGLITCPKPEKLAVADTNKWKVLVLMTGTGTKNSQPYKISKSFQDKNSKKAEQNATRECLIQFYQMFPDILQKISKIKAKKGICT